MMQNVKKKTENATTNNEGRRKRTRTNLQKIILKNISQISHIIILFSKLLVSEKWYILVILK